MRDLAEQLMAQTESFLPTLLAALAILVVGWLVALLVAALVRAALKRTTLDDRIAAWMKGAEPEEAADLEIERKISRLVFWMLMLLVLVAFFQTLGLTMVSEPLNVFLERVVGFLPQLIGAGALLLLAWLIATGLRFAVRKMLVAFRVDERVVGSAEAGGTEAAGAPLSTTLAETVYWLVFLLFLPMILGVLGLDGLLGPINELLAKLMAFLPNLIGAAVILLVGVFAARIVRRVLTNLLAAAGADRFGSRVGLDRALGSRGLSAVVGTVVYALVLVPVIILALDQLKLGAITGPASEMLEQILAAVPLLFAAALILGIAYAAGRVIESLVENVLAAVGFDRLVESTGIVSPSADAQVVGEPARRSPSSIVGTVVLVTVMLFASIEALEMLNLGHLAVMLTSLTVFLGKVLLGLLVFALGLYLGRWAAATIRGSGIGQAALLATVARGAIVVLSGAMALRQIGIGDDIILLAFGLLLGAFAVAVAIAFGIGGRDLAARALERWQRELGGGF